MVGRRESGGRRLAGGHQSGGPGEAGVAPAEAVYVGDLYSVDVLGARAAGLDGILLDPGGFWAPRDCRLARGLDEAVRLALE